MCLKTIVFCVLIVLLVDFVCNTEGLDEKGEGVCVVNVSSRQRRKKPYNVAINKWCGRRKCIVKRFKLETYLTWMNHTVCCNGWQHDSELDACAPICSTGCIGGRCVSPDHCRCISPAYLNPERPNTCITPVCNPECVNADCHANNTCVCKPNYTPYNSTHCFKCDQGYTADENLNCVPICEQPCINATCTGPNTCSCFDGFKPKNSSTCEPKCDCVNADCVAPDTCSCFKGYVPVNKTACAPKCNSCSHGDCVGPDNCSCHDGYVKINGVCKPKCFKGCVNGECTAPNVCSCKTGFVKSNTSANICVVPCDENCRGYCDESGGCVKWNCSSTPIRLKGKFEMKLVCCKNFEFDVPLQKCLPMCPLGCTNGRCVDVGKCVCDPPLILVDHACVAPTCTNCENGVCVGQNDCRCHKGYMRTNGTCEPICDFVCVNGKCAEPNKCKCDSGYKPDPNNTFNCLPICDTECVHGTCVAHNKCLCNFGYESTGNSSVCKPKCDGCDHGYCDTPYNCTCLEGYGRINSTCAPKCSACKNGNCVAPEQCSCPTGYELNEEGCMPICSPPCDNGNCTAPNQCFCNEGYNLTEAGCKPECPIPCINGNCSAPNTCTCMDGYVKDDINHSFCYKPCDPPCWNGTCDLYETCTCSADFEYDNQTNSCAPVKLIACNECSNNCTKDHEKCRCDNGTLCYFNPSEFPPEFAETKMAGLDLTLISIGGACLLLLILVVVVMQRIWHKRNEYGNKPTNDGSRLGSVVYTVPHTLIQSKPVTECEDPEDSCDEETTTEILLRREAQLS